MGKTNEEYLSELQKLSDKHFNLKESIEELLFLCDQIEDKLKNSKKVFSITESITQRMNEMNELEEEYFTILENAKIKK